MNSEEKGGKELVDALVDLKSDEVLRIVKESLDSGVDPTVLLEECREAMVLVGERYQKGEYFLSELLIASEIFNTILEYGGSRLVERKGSVKGWGTIVLGTVQGDVHNIGKNIVGAILKANEFKVIDVGEDVPPDEFAEKAREAQAQVVGMSALLSTAVSKIVESIATLKEKNMPLKTIVGGSAVTQQISDSVGADAYGKDPWDAVPKIRRLIGDS